MDDFIAHLSTEEDNEYDKKPAAEEPTTAKKSKAASVELPKEPDVPKEETESKAAATNDSPAQLIHNFIMGGR